MASITYFKNPITFEAAVVMDTTLTVTGVLTLTAALDINNGIDQDVALVAAGDAFNSALTINSATAAVQGLDISVTQLTTPRSSGVVDAAVLSTTSLAGDSGGVYNDLRFEVTDGGGSAVHNAMYVAAGFDALMDLSTCATGEADIVLADNLASALMLREAANIYATLTTTDAAEVLSFNAGLVLGVRFDDSIPLRFGTPGTDLVFTPDGTDVNVTSTGDLVFADSVNLILGTGKDLTMVHNGTNTLVTSAVGNLLVDNTSATGAVYVTLGTDDTATEFAIRNNSETRQMLILADGQVDFAGNVDANLGLDVTGGDLTVASQNLVLSGTAEIVSDRVVVIVTVLVAGTGGSTDGTLDINILKADGAAVSSAKRIYIIATDATGGGEQDLDATITFSAATLGSIVATGAGYCEALSDATGNFACTIANSADDATFVSVMSSHGVALAGQGCLIAECVEKTATWTA